MKNPAQQKNMKKTGGFTLVETLVAIAILMIAVAGPLTVAEKGLSASIYAKNQLMASYLAQDAMESIKNIVDTNELVLGSDSSADTNDAWLYYPGVSVPQSFDLSVKCSSQDSQCTIDTIGGGVTPCSPASSCEPLDLSPCGFVQGSLVSGCTPDDGAADTKTFTRTFYVQPFSVKGGACDVQGDTSGCDAANVFVSVTWPGDTAGGGGLTLADTLFDTLQ